MSEFIREERYLVFKLSDIDAVGMTLEEYKALQKLSQHIDQYRKEQGKDPLQCVVVESDWPEYESTWKAIEERCCNESSRVV